MEREIPNGDNKEHSPDTSKPENDSPSESVIDPSEVDDLYDEADRYFFAKRSQRKVEPAIAVGMLTETIDTPSNNGKYVRLIRERPAYIDDPTSIADEAPLAQVDVEGKSKYHTPFDVQIIDSDSGDVMQRFSIARSGPSGKGNEIDGWAFDYDNDTDSRINMTKDEFAGIMSYLK